MQLLTLPIQKLWQTQQQKHQSINEIRAQQKGTAINTAAKKESCASCAIRNKARRAIASKTNKCCRGGSQEGEDAYNDGHGRLSQSEWRESRFAPQMIQSQENGFVAV